MAQISAPKGTRDFYPEEMATRQFIFTSWSKTCKRYGFELFDAPMFEYLELYTQKSGDEIEKQLYTFQDKGGRNMALRPELTPSLARMVASRGQALKRPIRWYSIPRLFRYERMQKGRLREFFQLNMDILGIETIVADAELIAAVIDMMRDLGFTSDDFQVRISSRTLLDQIFSALGVGSDQQKSLYALLDKKGKIPSEQFESELYSIVPDKTTGQKILNTFDSSSTTTLQKEFGTVPALKELIDLFDLLTDYGFKEYTVFDIGIVRGLAYYTGIVFEVFDSKKSMRAIAGGGRYDTLVQLYGGPPTPAVGFAAGDVVLGELLKAKGTSPTFEPRCEVFIVTIGEISTYELITTTQMIRNQGISCEYALKGGSVGKQIKNANAARARFTLFLGGEELEKGLVKLKNMNTGKEILIPKEKVDGAVKG